MSFIVAGELPIAKRGDRLLCTTEAVGKTMPDAGIFLPEERMRRWWCWLWIIGRVWRRYNHHMGRGPHLFRPRRFSEKMQWRKLFDLDPIYAVFSDKVATRWGTILLLYRSRHCGRPTSLNAVTAPAGTL